MNRRFAMAARSKALVWVALLLAAAALGVVAELVLRRGRTPHPPPAAPRSLPGDAPAAPASVESGPLERSPAAAGGAPRDSLAEDPAAHAEAERRVRARAELERALSDLARHRTLQSARTACEQAVELSIELGGAGEVVPASAQEQRALAGREPQALRLERDGRCYGFRAGQYPEYDELCALLASGPKALAALEPARLEALLGRIEARAKAALARAP